ncbi:hypothetical protein K432DRAFT_362360 [Lepidopterella palustris CBS 459.81]|uniref:Uncharacterized protein n=1 Tax=Lepidopterella palustris CBS 459.81 TaxID=1314670 RepID=A0A8E2JAC7_9PEZI|nr:hypothetical protein K432DRAFT_362360 [Lepidopterella palustris CBS 459.81]
MPNFRTISISLRSQYDVDSIPEFDPPDKNAKARFSTTPLIPSLPKAIDETTSTASVYIPVYPSSQFWVCYNISPPVHPGTYFFFKLFINGAHVVSWGCGKEAQWKGKTMFALYESPEDKDAKKRVEKRALFFAPKGEGENTVLGIGPTAFVEVRVHRANGRRREVRRLEEFSKTFHGQHGHGIELVNAGPAKKEHPKRYYTYALVDPVDQPFATFKYYYRSFEQLEKLGVLDSVSEDDDSTLSGLSGTATETSTREYKEAESCHSITEDDRSELGGNDTPTSDSRRHSAPLTALQPQSEIPQGIVESPLRRSIQETPKNFYRLSVPPSLRLAPPASHLAASPKKTTPNGSLASLIEVPRLVGEWAQRTPSPIKSIRSGIQSPTPSETRKRGNSMAALRNVVASALRRRVVTNPDSPSGSSSRNTS